MTQFPSKFNISSQSGSEQFFYFLYLSMFQKIASLLSKVQPNDFLVIFGKNRISLEIYQLRDEMATHFSILQSLQ